MPERCSNIQQLHVVIKVLCISVYVIIIVIIFKKKYQKEITKKDLRGAMD